VSCPFRRFFHFCIIISRIAIRYDFVSLNSIPAFTVIHSMGPDADPDLAKLVNTKISCHDEASVQNLDYIVINYMKSAIGGGVNSSKIFIWYVPYP